MNYYNPYFSSMPYYGFSAPMMAPRSGLFSRLTSGGIKWGNILDYAQRTLNLINQGIPLVKQASPIIRNAKTMFKVMNEFKRLDSVTTNNTTTNNVNVNTNINNTDKNTSTNSNITYDGGPVFFI